MLEIIFGNMTFEGFVATLIFLAIIINIIALYVKFLLVAEPKDTFQGYVFEKMFLRDKIAIERSRRHQSIDVSVEDYISCYFCDEKIRKKARICRFCEREQPDREQGS